MELFDANENYTKYALHIDREMQEALAPIFKKYLKEGAKIRELAYIACEAIQDVHLGLLHQPSWSRRRPSC